MGAPKGGGYIKQSTLTGTGENTLEALLQNALQSLQQQGGLENNPLYKQAVEGTQSLLPGGNGFAPIQQEAQRQFQQQTVPDILNAFGQGSKGGSALNQALGNAGQNLNSSLGSMLAQLRLQASSQAGNLAAAPAQQSLQQAQTGLNVAPFAYQQRATPFWQDATIAAINAGGKVASAAAGGGV